MMSIFQVDRSQNNRTFIQRRALLRFVEVDVLSSLMGVIAWILSSALAESLGAVLGRHIPPLFTDLGVAW